MVPGNHFLGWPLLSVRLCFLFQSGVNPFLPTQKTSREEWRAVALGTLNPILSHARAPISTLKYLFLKNCLQINNMKTKFKETIEKCDSLEHKLNDLLKERQSLERKWVTFRT